MASFYIIVPVLNEGPNLDRLFAGFRGLSQDYAGRYQVQVILVDDGSTDDTATLAQNLAQGLDFQLLQHPQNLGPGQAFGTAFEYLAPRLAAEDWVLTIEGDNTSRQELIGQMFTRSLEGYEVILASVYMYGGGITNTSTLRVILSNVANTFVKEFLGIAGIFTASSFFRLHRGEVILKLQAHYGPRIMERAGFESMVEMLMKMVYLKTRISEVPMVLDTQLRQGKSKMKILRTIRGYFALFPRKGAWQQAATDR
jgi:dolichol-phosphate mannosyltransferase